MSQEFRIKLRSIHVETLIQVFNSLKERGDEYIDIHARITDKRDFLSFATAHVKKEPETPEIPEEAKPVSSVPFKYSGERLSNINTDQDLKDLIEISISIIADGRIDGDFLTSMHS